MSTQSQEKLYTIKEASQLSGLPSSTLRYYESIGIIDSVTRDASSGHRTYTQDEINTIDAVACLNATGMPLEDMRAYLGNRHDRVKGADAEIELLQNHKQRLADELAFIQLRRAYVDLKISYWRAIKAGDKKQVRRITEEVRVLAKALKFPNQHKEDI
jgi:DNA-binding transcriptional MerR regulator